MTEPPVHLPESDGDPDPDRSVSGGSPAGQGSAEPLEAVAPAEASGADQPGTSGTAEAYRNSSLWQWRGGHSLMGGALFALFGLLLVAGALAYRQGDVLENARPADLVRILSSLESENDRLASEQARLRSELADLQSGSQDEALAAARTRLQGLQVLAGTTPVAGSGIRIVLHDPQAAFAASDMLDAVQELRDAGAESIQISTDRVVVDTWFTDPPDGEAGIIISGTRRPPPYTILAIGDPQTLATALQIPGGVNDTVTSAGGSLEVERHDHLEIHATVPMQAPQYAEPANGQ